MTTTKIVRSPRTTKTHYARMRHCADIIRAARNGITQIAAMESNMPASIYGDIATAAEALEQALDALKKETEN